MTHLDLGPLHQEPINVRPPFHLRRAVIHHIDAHRADFLNAVHEPLVGVVLGAYDQRMIRWLAGWDTPTVGTIVSLLHRARAAAPLPTGELPMTARGGMRSGVKHGLTPDRSRPVVENGAYAAFAGRVIRAAGRRIGAGDVEGLAELATLALDVEESIGHAVSGLRRAGYSWAEIAARLGVTRQAAHQRWATTPAAAGSMVGEVA